ncbi:Glycosyl transferases group 1 [Rubripirellula obstinata]|uniref:Glycosyl transferases group 1 n=1 Tax=Rubripirellula obstinata TaxID=406547 RepID=A0A5B1CGV1_9BACT|nr:glycosyltransferase family 4 protein [Rubripirellula obstinata]KAA1260428.1 Glycosyl transferases group 1 [Rubripirellula obstinata]
MKSDPIAPPNVQNLHVVFQVNFVAPNLIAVMQELAKRVGKLTILSSVDMEANRDWKADWQGLEVVVQNTWTLTRKPVHPSGYQEINYIHIPLDTFGQLRRLKPDVIVSLEMGARSLLASLHCRFMRRKTKHVLAVYASERSEAGRGPLRRWLRRRLVAKAKVITSNGPSCTRLLKSYGAETDKILPWNYASDPCKRFTGEVRGRDDAMQLELLTVGQLTERKGIITAAEQLTDWATQNPATTVRWNVVGTGPLAGDLETISRPANLNLVMHGHQSPQQIIDHYRDNDFLLFPTLADEWGLVVDEALHSGLPVLGSVHSQAAETLIANGKNGWTYDPEHPGGLSSILGDVQPVFGDAYQQMTCTARESVSERTAEASAEQLVTAMKAVVSP